MNLFEIELAINKLMYKFELQQATEQEALFLKNLYDDLHELFTLDV